jgi:hypothetical protein
VLGPDGLSRFEELSRRGAARTAILYTFDLIEHDGEDLRNLPFRDRKGGAGATATRYSFRDAGQDAGRCQEQRRNSRPFGLIIRLEKRWPMERLSGGEDLLGGNDSIRVDGYRIFETPRIAASVGYHHGDGPSFCHPEDELVSLHQSGNS